MFEQVYFYPDGSSKGFPVNSRKDILDILREKQPAIFFVDIDFHDGVYLVLATFQGDSGWFGVGHTTGNI